MSAASYRSLESPMGRAPIAKSQLITQPGIYIPAVAGVGFLSAHHREVVSSTSTAFPRERVRLHKSPLTALPEYFTPATMALGSLLGHRRPFHSLPPPSVLP